jgi:hypothetical protein
MSARRILTWVAVALIVAGIAGIIVVQVRRRSVTLAGEVLRQDSDPRKQLPIPNVKITATEGERTADGASDASGLFRLQLPNGGWRDQPIVLKFRQQDYQPMEVTPSMNDQLYIVRMTPLPTLAASPAGAHEIAVKDVRVRYAEKTSSTVNVGSTAKTFIVLNTGNVPCASKPPCSPDGKWKAALGGTTIDAGEGQQFRNTRVSCIAGPCAFTKIETGAISDTGRTTTVTVRNWSDTVTYLVEAEVTRNMPSDAIRQAYPAIYGRAMSFTLPSTAEGPSVEADLDGAEIIFPLGPGLRLSWAECSLQIGTDQTKLYRCELKPGYQFQ